MTIINKVSAKSVMPGVTPAADVVDAPTIGTATDIGTSRAYNNGAATVTFTPAPTGGTATSYTASSTPGSITASGASSPLTVTGLASSTAYTFKTYGTNASGTWSAVQSSASNSITATTVPENPTVTAANVGTGRAYNNGAATITVTGGATGGKTISSYSATSSPGSFTASGSSPLTVTGLASATAYTFNVTATNANGTSTATTSGSVTATTVPQNPTIGTATNASGQAYTGSAAISVPFTAGATGGSAVTSYTVTSSSGATGTGAASPISVTETVGNPTSTARTYTVTATNANGTSVASSASNSIAASSVPQAPTIGTASNPSGVAYSGTGQTSVTFTANATGGSAITGYTVTSSSGLTGTGSASPITVSGETLAVARTYTVTATNANGTSTASAASNSSTPSTIPQAPTIGTATAGIQNASVTFTAGATGGSAITTYTVTSSPGSITGTGAASPITVSGLTAGTAYTFTVTATNANGTSTASSASNSVTPLAPYFMGFVENSSPSIGSSMTSSSAKDSSQNLYIAGSTKLSDNSKRYCFISKINSSGDVQWQRHLQTGIDSNNDGTSNGTRKVIVSSSGNVYILGTMWDNTLGAYYFVGKYDTSGTFQWARRVDVASATAVYQGFDLLQATGFTIDSSENVYTAVSGYDSSNSYGQATIFKYNSSGTLQWQRDIRNTASANRSAIWIGALTVDSSGNVFIGGSGENAGTNIDHFVGKINSSGTGQWIRKLVPTTSDIYRQYTTMYDAICDSSGNVYVAGAIKNSSGGYPGYIVKYDTNGTIQWQKTISNSVSDASVNNTIVNMVIDGSSNIFIGGNNNSTVASNIGYISKLTTAGALSSNLEVYSNAVPNSKKLTFRSLSLDTLGNLYFSGNAVYETNGAYAEGIFAKIPNDNSKLGTYTISRSNAVITATTANITIANGTSTESAHNYITLGTSGTGTSNTVSSFTSVTNNYTFIKLII